MPHTLTTSKSYGYDHVEFTLPGVTQSDLTEVLITLEKDGNEIVHPMYWKGADVWAMNCNLEAGSYDWTIRDDGDINEIGEDLELKSYDRRFVTVNGNQFKKGHQKFYPFGTNGNFANQDERGIPFGVQQWVDAFDRMNEEIPDGAVDRLLRWNLTGHNRFSMMTTTGLRHDRMELLEEIIHEGVERMIHMYITFDHRSAIGDFQGVWIGKDHTQQWQDLWAGSTFNSANPGGLIIHPREWITNATCIEIEKARTRHIMARFGWCPWIMCHEMRAEGYLWDWFRETPETFATWDSNAVTYLRSIDPYGRLITSGGGENPQGDVYSPEYVDFHDCHCHPNVNKSKLTSEEGSGKWNAIANHTGHSSTVYMDGSIPCRWGAIGNGQYYETILEDGKDDADFLPNRVLSDRHRLLETIFGGVTDVCQFAGCGFIWDNEAAMFTMGGIEYMGGIARYLVACRFKSHTYVPLGMQDVNHYLRAHILQADESTLVHIYDTENDAFQNINQDWKAKKTCDFRFPVSFSGKAIVFAYNAETGRLIGYQRRKVKNGRCRVCGPVRRDVLLRIEPDNNRNKVRN